MSRTRRGRQLGLFDERRKRVGGKPRGRRPRDERRGFIPHVARPAHEATHPVHVSMKRVPIGPSFRAQRVYAAIRTQIAASVARGVRVVHYSVQHDHLHLLVEAADKPALGKGLKLLFSRIAFAVNAVARRHGSLFRDRHHRRDLATPTETRRVLVYLFFNSRKHDLQHFRATNATFELDAMTSAAWFDGWHELVRPPPEAIARARAQCATAPVAAAETWLAKGGWKRGGGPIGFHEVPVTRSKRRHGEVRS